MLMVLPNPENRNQLIIDTETAPIIRKIFDMYVNGDRLSTIVQYLFDNRVLKPLALRFQRTQHPILEKHMVEPYTWTKDSIYRLVSNQVYIGHTITNQSHRLSYKCKKLVKHNTEDMYIFPNTHEPIVDEEIFELAQKRLASRHRSCKSEIIDMYSRLFFAEIVVVKCIVRKTQKKQLRILAENIETAKIIL